MGRFRWAAAAVVAAMLCGAVVVGGTSPGEATVGDRHVMTIPAAAFTPSSHQYRYVNEGYRLYNMDSSGNAVFVAPVVFPVDLDHVRIISVALRAYDDSTSGDVCLGLYRAEPKDGDLTHASEICTTGASNSDRSFSDRSIRPRTGRPTTSFFLYLVVGEAPGLRFYGATITWEEI